MCIIAIKPAGKEMMSDEIIENMFQHNSDGAGLMYPENGAVHILKGFMDLKSFKKAISKIPDVKNKTVVLHCRIATAGGINAAMCHPFPLSDKDERLRAVDVLSPVGIAHNGVLPNKPRKGFSDTADYIKYQLYPHTQMVRNWRTNEMMHDLIAYETEGSRLAILLNNGTVIRTGNWEEDDGYFYSNSSYESYRYSRALSSYIWDDWDDYGGVYSYGSYGSYGTYGWDKDRGTTFHSSGYHEEFIKLYDLECCLLDDETGEFTEIFADEYAMDEFGDVYMMLWDPDAKMMEYYPTNLVVCDSSTLRELTVAQVQNRARTRKALTVKK